LEELNTNLNKELLFGGFTNISNYRIKKFPGEFESLLRCDIELGSSSSDK
jgi:hypothetical protein